MGNRIARRNTGISLAKEVNIVLRIVNQETGKEAFVINDNGEILINGKVEVSEEKIAEALNEAKKKEGEE